MRWIVGSLLCSVALLGCKDKCCEFVCVDEESLTSRCQTEKVHDAAECKEVIEDICGEPAAEHRIECHETTDGVECDYPASGVAWDLYDDDGSACSGGKWGSDWCDAVFE